MAETPQSYSNHARRDLPYLLALIILSTNFIVTTWNAILADRIHFVPQTILWVAVAFALLIIAYKARSNALKAQDRTIRLEERMRYATLLPTPLLTRTAELTTSQVVALRFASDAELPALIVQALDGKLTSKQIKQAITNWRPDYQRV